MAVAIDFRNERTIGAPRERVYDFVADMRNDPQWCPGVASAEAKQGGVGDADAIYAVGQRMGEDQVVPMDYRVDSSDRPNRIVWTSEMEGLTYRSVFEFDDADGATRVRQHNRTNFQGMPDEAQDEMQAQALQFSNMQFDALAKLMEAD